ncbi:MAG: NADH-quinone oxidoreductase subunit M [Candidatus Eisenbacteria bacterium]|nr:NADH-quinone oxidoreductase subunit M [Candidatus Eisenbacteria bacterium]
MTFPILSVLTFFPLAAIVLLLPMDSKKPFRIKTAAFAFSLAEFVLSLILLAYFKPSIGGPQLVERLPWIPAWGVTYFLGVDGISLFLVLLTTFLTSLSILSTWTAITERVKEFMIAMLLLEVGMIGVFFSLDLFLFYVFWEVMLIPMYLMIGMWGGPRRIYAAVKFILYTMAGSVLMLVAILALHFLNYSLTGIRTFSILDLYGLPLPYGVEFWLFLAFFIAFAIKVPVFPFHTWLPDAHVEAPTAGSVILAGVLLKMGTYGFLRLSLPLFPVVATKLAPFISILGIIGIIYGALVATVQKDVKRLVAFSSVSHLGFAVVGIFALNIQGIEGSILQMINHGIATGALFLIVGMFYERRHTRMIEDYGGLWKSVPNLGVLFLIITLSSIGLPGLGGFVSEFLILVGVFKARVLFAVLSATGVVLAAVYMLWMFQRVMFGPITKDENRHVADLNLREKVILIATAVATLWVGIFPTTLLSRIEPSVRLLLERVQTVGYADSARENTELLSRIKIDSMRKD